LTAFGLTHTKADVLPEIFINSAAGIAVFDAVLAYSRDHPQGQPGALALNIYKAFLQKAFFEDDRWQDKLSDKEIVAVYKTIDSGIDLTAFGLTQANGDVLGRTSTKTFIKLNTARQLDRPANAADNFSARLALLKEAFFRDDRIEELSAAQVVEVLNSTNSDPHAFDEFGAAVQKMNGDVLARVDGRVFDLLNDGGALDAVGSDLEANPRLAILQTAYFSRKSPAKNPTEENELKNARCRRLSVPQIRDALQSLYDGVDLRTFGLDKTFADALEELSKYHAYPEDESVPLDPDQKCFYAKLFGKDVTRKNNHTEIAVLAHALFGKDNLPISSLDMVAVVHHAANSGGVAWRNVPALAGITDARSLVSYVTDPASPRRLAIFRRMFPTLMPAGTTTNVFTLQEEDVRLALLEVSLFTVDIEGKHVYYPGTAERDRVRYWKAFIDALNLFADDDQPNAGLGVTFRRADLLNLIPQDVVLQMWSDGQLGGSAKKDAADRTLRNEVRLPFLARMLYDSACPFEVRQELPVDDVTEILSEIGSMADVDQPDNYGTVRNVSVAMKFLLEGTFEPPFDHARLLEWACQDGNILRDAILHYYFVHGHGQVSLGPDRIFCVIERAYSDLVAKRGVRLVDQVSACSAPLSGMFQLLTEEERENLAKFTQDIRDRDGTDENRKAVCDAILLDSFLNGGDETVRALSGSSILHVAHLVASGKGTLQSGDGKGKPSFSPNDFGQTATMEDVVDRLLEKGKDKGLKFEAGLRAFLRTLYTSRNENEGRIVLFGNGSDSTNVKLLRSLAPKWDESVSLMAAEKRQPGGGAARQVPASTKPRRFTVKDVPHATLLFRLVDALVQSSPPSQSKPKGEAPADPVSDLVKFVNAPDYKGASSATVCFAMQGVRTLQKVTWESVTDPATALDRLVAQALSNVSQNKSIALQRFVSFLVLIFFGFFFRKTREVAWVLFCVLDGSARAASVQMFLSALYVDRVQKPSEATGQVVPSGKI
jgi:hypothetical protein